MRFLGNLLWIVIGGGLVTCVQYLLAGVILCLTIIGIPFGVQCFKLAELALWPFGRDMMPASRGSAGVSFIMNVLWLVLGGIWIALTHVGFALLCAITIIGIPFAVQHFKLARLALFPFGKSIL